MSNRRPQGDSYTDETIPMQRPAVPSRQGTPRRDSTRDSRRSSPRPPLAPPPAPRRATSLRSWLRRLALLLLVLLILVFVGIVILQQSVARTVALADVRDNRPPARPLVMPINILLLGVDLREQRPEEGIRSDTLILLHLDPGGAWASMLSIPRDTVANVPGFGESKINAAFMRGYDNAEELYGSGTDPVAAGAALAADTVEQFLQLPAHGTRIHYVATINFNGFAQMIDAVGGIEVDVPFEIVDTEYPTEDFGTTTIRIPAGRQRMDGERALQYVRTRHADSDFGRAERQQQVIQAIVQELRNRPALLRPITGLRLMGAAGEATRTTMPVGRPDALLMGPLLSRIEPEQIAQYRINPDDVAVTEAGFNLIWDPTGVQELVRKMLTPPAEAEEQAVIQVLNGAGVGGVAGRVSEALREQGFTVTTPGNAEQTPTTQIIDYGDHPATRTRLSRALNGLPVTEGSSFDAPPGVDIVIILGEDYESFWRDR
jgi:polyisoprenyl-teichoic acid--peptidoglycan teichoic acid transferase